MKILHVISGISRISGGPARSSQGLVAAECRAGVDAWIYPFDGAEPWIEGVRKYKLKGAELDAADLAQFDIVHIHGIWSPRLHNVAKMCRAAKVPYIIAPRGMLDPWALSVKPFRKMIARILYQDRDLCGAAAIHATAVAEAEHIREVGFTNKIIISPNGIDAPKCSKVEGEMGNGNNKIALFLSRLHPGKGLMALAESWAKVRPQGWVMRVVGPDSYGHKADVVAKLHSLGIEEDWQFRDMVDDEEKWREYAAADLLVHPSVSENFGITIAEGLAAGLPVICTKGTPWSDIEEMRCGWWIDVGVDSLVTALKSATSLTEDERGEMGKRGRKLVEEKYTWEAVCGKMVEGYESILNHGIH